MSYLPICNQLIYANIFLQNLQQNPTNSDDDTGAENDFASSDIDNFQGAKYSEELRKCFVKNNSEGLNH